MYIHVCVRAYGCEEDGELGEGGHVRQSETVPHKESGVPEPNHRNPQPSTLHPKRYESVVGAIVGQWLVVDGCY